MMRVLNFAFATFLMFGTTFSYAADIIKIQGANVLIDLKGETVAVGDQFWAINSAGKKVAILHIGKIRGDKAIARTVKGKTAIGMTLQPKPLGKTSKTANNRPVKSKKSDAYWGALAGYSMDTMKVKVLWQEDGTTDGVAHTNGQEKEVASISGSGYSAKGLFDYDLGAITLRTTAGIETYNVSGSNSCGAGNDSVCTTKIMYMSADGLARYRFTDGAFRPWMGLGLSLLFPLSGSGTAIASSSIGSTWMGIVAGGVDWYLKPDLYIPISLEYGMFPPTDQVNASWIQLRIGFAVPY